MLLETDTKMISIGVAAVMRNAPPLLWKGGTRIMHDLVNCDKCGEAHKPEYTLTMNYKAFKINYRLCAKCFEQQLTFIGQYYESGLL